MAGVNLLDPSGQWSPQLINWVVNGQGTPITINGAKTAIPSMNDPGFATWVNQFINDVGQGAQVASGGQPVAVQQLAYSPQGSASAPQSYLPPGVQNAGGGNYSYRTSANSTDYYNPSTGQTWSVTNGKTGAGSSQPFKGLSPGTVSFGSQNIPGVGNVPVYENSSGMTYYQSPGGQMNALNSDQISQLRLSQVAGYDANGNPVFSAPPTAQQQANANNTPETNAFNQIQQTDPNTANLITQLGNYYTDLNKTIQGTQATQGDLNTYYQNMGKALANGGTVATPQIQQAARAAQVARGNYQGTAQAAQEAMSTGLEGENEAQQLAAYNTGLQNTAAGISSYLNSGTTPYSEGSRALSDIINQYNSSNSQVPYQSTYNPSQTYTYLNPNAPSAFSQGANGFYNSANYQYLGSGASGYGQLSPGVATGAGALSGAASGAAAGSMVMPGWGTAIGAGLGALAGGLGGGLR